MKKLVSEENKDRRQNNNMALTKQMCILDPFLQNTFIIFSLGQEWHFVFKIKFLCGGSGSVIPILPRRTVTFLLMDFIF